jgi:hypothetical protein
VQMPRQYCSPTLLSREITGGQFPTLEEPTQAIQVDASLGPEYIAAALRH